MSKIEEIEKAAEDLPLADFARLAAWVSHRSQLLNISTLLADQSRLPIRDHSAFLSSYSPEDEGLYDDAAAG
jgi:hypothetical protein